MTIKRVTKTGVVLSLVRNNAVSTPLTLEQWDALLNRWRFAKWWADMGRKKAAKEAGETKLQPIAWTYSSTSVEGLHNAQRVHDLS